MHKSILLIILLGGLLTLTAGAQSAKGQDAHRLPLRQRIDSIQVRVDSLRRIVREKADSVKLIHAMDSLLDLRDERAKLKYDTLYIAKPGEHWTVRLRGSVTGNHILIRGRTNGESLRSSLDAAHKLTLSLAVGYRGITFSLSANPLKWAGKYKDLEYNVISYGRKFGFDASFISANTYGGYMRIGSSQADVEKGKVSQKQLNLSGYYVFNHRKFSYPAAFSQSQIQLRSAGSWLLAASVSGGKIKDFIDTEEFHSPAIRHLNLGIGGGYGYNLVLHRIMIHASMTSELVVGNWSRVKTAEGKTKMPWRFPNFIVQGRIAALYNWKRSFIGFSSTSNFSSMGDKKQLDILQLHWLARAFYGFRF